MVENFVLGLCAGSAIASGNAVIAGMLCGLLAWHFVRPAHD